MNIFPQRRQRILQAHHMRQQGSTLRKIGKTLGVSHATIVADLKLLESHWGDVTAQATDDALLEQLQLLMLRLRTVLPINMLKTYGNFTPADFARIYVAHTAELGTLLREVRRTAAALQDRAQLRLGDDAQPALELPFPDAELARAAHPARPKPADRGQPQLTKPDHSNDTIPSPALENAVSPAPEKIPDQPLDQPQAPAELDQALAEAQAFLEQLQNQTTPDPNRSRIAA